MRFLRILLALAAVGLLLAGQANAQPCSEFSWDPNEIGIRAVGGLPGDTIWAPVFITNDSGVLAFVFYIDYDTTLLHPVPAAPGSEYIAARPVGRFTGSSYFAVQFSTETIDSSAIIASMLPAIAFNDTLPPGNGPIFEIPFVISYAAIIGTSSTFQFPRRDLWVVDTTVYPPDSSIQSCRLSHFNEIRDAPYNGEDIYPTPVESNIYVTDNTGPSIESFWAWPRSVYIGEEATLFYDVLFADSVTINNGIGTFISSKDRIDFFPNTTADYTLTAYGDGNPVQSHSVRIHAVPEGANAYPWWTQPLYDTIETTIDEIFWLEFSAWDPDNTLPRVTVTNTTPDILVDTLYPPDGGTDVIFLWTPDSTDIGLYTFGFYATDELDPALVDSFAVILKVNDINHPPDYSLDLSEVPMCESDSAQVVITATDPDGTTPSIFAHLYNTDTLATNMNFVDSGDGNGVLTFTPDNFQGNNDPDFYYVAFTVRDQVDPVLLVNTSNKQISVYNKNTGTETPTIRLDPDSASFTVVEGQQLVFDIFAENTNGDIPVLSVLDSLPAGALFEIPSGEQHDNHRRFTWQPNYDQAGEYTVSFVATNVSLADTIEVPITVEQGNQAPLVFVPPTQQRDIYEDDTLQMLVYGLDPDSTTPSLTAHLDGTDSLATNMVFIDSGNGIGVLTFTPNRSQGTGTDNPVFYYLRFIATDSLPPYPTQTSSTVTIRLYDNGLPCCIGTAGDVNNDGDGHGEPNVADITRLVDYLFLTHTLLPCALEAEIDGVPNVSVGDLTYLVDFLFRGGPPPPECELSKNQ